MPPDDAFASPLALPARGRFQDPDVTATGEARASVALSDPRTLWFNTGTLCNIDCPSCYIESSPKNDRLVYMTRAEVERFLEEARALDWPLREVGFTGGEPFMNPEMIGRWPKDACHTRLGLLVRARG